MGRTHRSQGPCHYDYSRQMFHGDSPPTRETSICYTMTVVSILVQDQVSPRKHSVQSYRLSPNTTSFPSRKSALAITNCPTIRSVSQYQPQSKMDPNRRPSARRPGYVLPRSSGPAQPRSHSDQPLLSTQETYTKSQPHQANPFSDRTPPWNSQNPSTSAPAQPFEPGMYNTRGKSATFTSIPGTGSHPNSFGLPGHPPPNPFMPDTATMERRSASQTARSPVDCRPRMVGQIPPSELQQYHSQFTQEPEGHNQGGHNIGAHFRRPTERYGVEDDHVQRSHTTPSDRRYDELESSQKVPRRTRRRPTYPNDSEDRNEDKGYPEFPLPPPMGENAGSGRHNHPPRIPTPRGSLPGPVPRPPMGAYAFTDQPNLDDFDASSSG